nr:uncharacterized protein LOC131779985 [Pocillopora verrucosa]
MLSGVANAMMLLQMRHAWIASEANATWEGPTDQEILQHLEEIVELALPLDKFKKPYEDVNTAKNLILNRVTFYQARVDVSKKQLLFLYLQLDLTSCSQDHW